ncbi:glycosyltransferase [Synechococcus sp. W4D4]|uniref:glycosyltransferase n=1 Tax=Synechococcus sp. W4D4 TaxID=3392294 RepID=UPI0039EAD631
MKSFTNCNSSGIKIESYFVNALSANNQSSANVVIGHVLNILTLEPDSKIILLVTSSSPLLKNLSEHLLLRRIRIIIVNSIFARSTLLRILYEQLVLPLLIPSNTLLFSVSGYFIFLKKGYQVTLIQNPIPFLPSDITNDFSSSIYLKTLLLAFRLSAQFTSSQRYLAFNSRHIELLAQKSLRLNHSFTRTLLLYNPVPSIPEHIINNLPELSPRTAFVAVGPIIAYKQAHLIFQAFIDFYHNVSSSFELIYIGKPCNTSYYESIKSDLDNYPGIPIKTITDYLPDSELQDILRSSFAYISMSLYESFGLPAIEAQRYGAPSLLLHGTAGPEIASRGCISIASSSALSLREAMASLVDNPSLWNELSNQAIQNSRKYCSPYITAPLMRLSNCSS